MREPAPAIRLPWPADRFEAITFDCYGTLIDWRPGILKAVRRVFISHGVPGSRISDQEILERYNQLESEAEHPPYRRYREVLAAVMQGLGRAFGFSPTTDELDALPDSLPGWKPYADTVNALRALKTRYRLGIISNIDESLFAHTAKLLEVPFDWVVTAESVGSYKPSQRNFEVALKRMGLGREKVLHAAQSRRHDIAAVKPMGWATVWVNRYGLEPDPAGSGSAQPDLEVPDLRTLVELLNAGR